MRVAIILDSLNRGGAERQAVYAVGQLARLGCDVSLIYYNRADYEYDAAVLPKERVIHLPKKGKPLRFLRRLRKLFVDRRFDVVHGWMSVPGVYGGFAGRLAGVPVVFAGFRCEYDATGLIRLAHRAVNRVVTGWIVNSKATVPSMVRGVGADPNRVFVVYNGIEPSAFASTLDPAGARTRLGLAADAPTVSIVGRLRAQKNHPLFIRMAALAARSIPEARFLVVGDGDGDEQQQLESQAQSLGVRDKVLFLGSRSDIPDILAATDIMTLTSHYEGVANSLLEAMCVGLPVVSTAYAGVEELITHEYDGLIAPLGDAERLAQYVTDLLRDPARRRHMGENGHKTIEQRFSMEAMGRNLLSVYEGCLLARKNSRAA